MSTVEQFIWELRPLKYLNDLNGNIHVLRKHNKGGGGSKNPKTSLRNTWMFPMGEPILSRS